MPGVPAATAQTEAAAAGAASLQVALDLADAVGLLGVGVVAHLTGGPAPAQQVPALVQGLFQLFEPGVLLARRDLAPAQLPAQRVLLIDQAVNPAQHSLVIHAGSLCADPQHCYVTVVTKADGARTLEVAALEGE